MADTVEAGRQHMNEEAADELVCGEGHGLVPRASLGPIILVFESHVAGLAGDQPAVGDGDAVGVAREVGEHGLGPAERRLGVNDPFDVA